MNNKRTISFISDSDFEKLLDNLENKGRVYIPQALESIDGREYYNYEIRSEDKKFNYFGFRPSQPLKTFLFSRRMKVAEYPAGDKDKDFTVNEQVFIVGAAACDIESLRSLDVVFLDEAFTDIFYRARRDNTFIITEDCSEPRETCFCTLAGNNPYPEKGFDLNLSRIEGGYIIEAGSEKGEEVLGQNSPLVSNATDAHLKKRDEIRSKTAEKIIEQNKEYELTKSRHDILEIQRESDDWYEHVKTCVECGACLFSCPTCHCFLLYDQKSSDGKFQRIKGWDVCVYSGFSKMAGGSSPRLGLMERFRHRYLHKLEYFPKNFGFEACTGCGRCIEGCMGKIDMRKVFKALDIEKVETR